MHKSTWTEVQTQPLITSLLSLEIWIVGLVVAASVVSERFLLPAIVTAASFWILRWLASGQVSIRTTADGAILLLICMLPITLLVTNMPEVTTPQVYRVISGIALFYAIVNWTTSRERLQVLISGILLLGVLLAGAAIVTVEWSTAKRGMIPRSFYSHIPLLVSDPINPNVMAGLLLLLLPFPLGLLLFAWQTTRWPTYLLAAFSLISAAGVFFLAQSRGGMIALVIMLAAMVFLRWRYGWVGLLGLLLIATFVVQTNWESKAIQHYTHNGQLIRSTNERFELWSRAWELIQLHPITGVGMGTYEQVVADTHPFDLVYVGLEFQQTGRGAHAHNLFLQIAVDLGIPGLLAWLTIITMVLRAAWRVYRTGKQEQQSWIQGIGAGLICSQVALLAHGLLDAVAWGMVRPSVMVWGLWGLTIAAEKRLAVEPDQ